jgi:two-component system response regulator
MNNKEILLIEDSETDAELTIRALKKNELVGKITHKSSGVDALHYLFSEREQAESPLLPSLILLDLKLPKMDGLEVLKAIKQDMATKYLPVVMLTSSKELPDIHSAYSLGANSYIVKPVEYEKFSEAIKAVANYWMWVNQSLPLK